MRIADDKRMYSVSFTFLAEIKLTSFITSVKNRSEKNTADKRVIIAKQPKIILFFGAWVKLFPNKIVPI